ncbi:MAG: 50S ribosomal protein L9 [Acidobacteria bacterium]|nr:50S ribosomal protein L9 [Acidobacteriota bacterium]MCI0719693.1 50S ribosomal protein L9 [Acidobacteriota bacterium]
MEIILRERIDKLGVRGDVVNVSAGYARNYLLPKQLAVLATPANIKQIEQERSAAVRREALERKDAEALARQLSQVTLQVNRKVGENEVLYGSVTSMDIAELLAAKGFTIDRRKLDLPEAIKSLGQHDVPIKLHREVIAFIKVEVLKEE